MKKSSTKMAAGATRAMPRRDCARLVTRGRASDDPAISPRAPSRSSLLRGHRRHRLGRFLGRHLPGEDALDTVPHRLVEQLGRADVDVRPELTLSAGEARGVL